LKHVSIPFDYDDMRMLYFGATVSYKGNSLPNLEPEEQLVLVVGKCRH